MTLVIYAAVSKKDLKQGFPYGFPDPAKEIQEPFRYMMHWH